MSNGTRFLIRRGRTPRDFSQRWIAPWSNPAYVNTNFTPLEAPEAGSLPIGEAGYAIPSSNVIYLATNGSDLQDGLTEGAAKATLSAAITACPEGGTIVVREGIYEQRHSSDLTKSLTIQNYPGEAVWFDGSKERVTASWANNGNGTWTASLFAQFTHVQPNGFSNAIDSSFPMAVWPDMVLIDGVRQQHRPNGTYSYTSPSGSITPLAETPGAGEFTLNYTNNTVTIGTNPSDKVIRLSNLNYWLVIKAPNVTIRGIGIRRYTVELNFFPATIIIATSGTNCTIENVVLEDAGQQALSIRANYSTIRNVSIRRASNLGIHSSNNDNYLYSGLLVEGCNFNRWKDQPSAGGIKWSWSDYGKIENSIIRDNYGTGIWWDVWCVDNVAFNVTMDNNTGPAMEFEICTGLLMVNCRAHHVGSSGYWVLSANGARIWNSTVDRASSFDIRIERDSRQNETGDPFDPRIDVMTADTEICNTILTNNENRAGVWRLYVADISKIHNSADLFSRAAGLVFSSPTAGSVSRMASVEDSTGASATYTTPGLFAAAMPAGKVGTNRVEAFTSTPSQATIDTWASGADEIPADAAALMGVSTGSKFIGPIVPEPTLRGG